MYLVPNQWEAGLQFLVFLTLEVVIAMHFIPDMLLYRTTGRWLLPLLPVIRAAMFVVWPIRVFLEGAESLARISEHEVERTEEQRTEEGIEALVEVAEEEGIIEKDQADLIEQVVEFSDKRVREVMTPRPDVVALQAEATLEEMHTRFVETKFSKMPVYEKSLDDIFGVVHAQDLLQIADTDLPKRRVRELVRAALFVPETKLGSDLLKEMRQRNQSMAIIIDEHGSVAGIATAEDLVEEIVGERGWRRFSARTRCGTRAGWQPGAAREHDDSGSGGIVGGSRGGECRGDGDDDGGIVSHLSGKVPAPGDKVDIEGYRFEVLEANQRKVLRLRARHLASAAGKSH